MSASSRTPGRPANTFTQRLATTPSGQGPSVGTWGYTNAGDVWVAAVDPGATGQSLWIQMVSSASIAIPLNQIPFGTGTGLTSSTLLTYDPTTEMMIAPQIAIVRAAQSGVAIQPLLQAAPGNDAAAAVNAQVRDVAFDLNRDVTLLAGAGLTNQLAFSVLPPTYLFDAPDTIPVAAAAYIMGAPLQSTNATITSSRGLWIDTGPNAAGVRTSLWVTGQANSGALRVPASTEQPDFVVDSTRTVTWDTGALALQRFNRMGAPTIAFPAPSTVTETSTLDVDGPQEGNNATFTAAYAIKASLATTVPNDVRTVMRLLRYVTGVTAGGAGIGAALELAAENGASNAAIAARLDGVLTEVATPGSEESRFSVNILGSGALGEALRVSGPSASAPVQRLDVIAGFAGGAGVYLAAAGEDAASINLRGATGGTTGSVRLRNPGDTLTIFGVQPNAGGTNHGPTLDYEDGSADPGGNVTIDHASGKAAFAAGSATCTVTNNLVTAASTVIPVLQEADGTLTSILRCVPGAGSFVVTGNAAATGVTTFGFIVLNPSA